MQPIWDVAFAGRKAEKEAKALPERAQARLLVLLRDLRNKGPDQPAWPHYSQLKGQKDQRKGEKRYHCHLQTGRQSVVACWKVQKSSIFIEVYYVGTHQNAPY
jgi:hypothetical protein